MSELSIEELSKRIDENDNRFTASPYLLLLRERREYVGHEEYGDTEECYVDLQGDYHKTKTLEEMVQYYKDCIGGEDTFKEEYPEGLIEDEHYSIHHMGNYMETVNVFLTDKGYEDHMRINGHNIRRSGGHDTFGIHAFRNPEIKTMFKAIKEYEKLKAENVKLRNVYNSAMEFIYNETPHYEDCKSNEEHPEVDNEFECDCGIDRQLDAIKKQFKEIGEV